MKKSICIIVFLFLSFHSLMVHASFVNSNQFSDTTIVDINGNGDFTTIQDAIDAADAFDTIYIKNGEYNEKVIIDKPLYLIGEDNANTIISGTGEKDVIVISAEQVHIEQVHVCKSGGSGRDAGIESNANYTTVNNCIISNSTIGIFLYYSSHHLIENNTLRNNKDYGLHLYNSYQNSINGNKISQNRWGVLLVYGQGNHISNNQITNNKYEGLWLLRGSVFNTIINNKITHNHKGIHLQLRSFNNTFLNNQISFNSEGIRIGSYWSCDNNLFQKNMINNNKVHGLFLLDSMNTQVIENTFLDNKIHAFFSDCMSSYWNQNYWGDSTQSVYVIKGKKNHIPWINIDWQPAQSLHELPTISFDAFEKEDVRRKSTVEIDLPDAFSWKNVNGIDYTSPVKNQIPTPSCEAYALCSALETMIHFDLQENVGCDLSEAHLFFYPGGTADWGVDVTEPAEYLINHGVPDEGCFPDPHRPYDFPFESIAGWEDRTVKIYEWGWVDNEINEIKQALIEHGPLTICHMTRKDLDFYSSGVYMPSLYSPIQRGHVTAIFGYDDEEQCLLIRNSGGDSWGEEGYFRISYEGFNELYSFIYPFYGGSGILYVDGVFGNLQPDVPRVEIKKPQFYNTYLNGYEFETVFPYISAIQNGAPRIIGPLRVAVDAEQAEYVEFYIDETLQSSDNSEPFTWDLECTKGLHVLEVVAYKKEVISKDVIDIFIL